MGLECVYNEIIKALLLISNMCIIDLYIIYNGYTTLRNGSGSLRNSKHITTKLRVDKQRKTNAREYGRAVTEQEATTPVVASARQAGNQARRSTQAG